MKCVFRPVIYWVPRGRLQNCHENTDQTRMSIGAAAVGVVAGFRRGSGVPKQRVQFGRPISSNQAVFHVGR